MWVVNAVLIFAAIALSSWLILSYGEELTKALDIALIGCRSLLVALSFFLLEAVKAAIIATVAGGVGGLIFVVAGAPDQATKAGAISIASFTFALLMIKALWENYNNLRWSIRHAIRNRYRKW